MFGEEEKSDQPSATVNRRSKQVLPSKICVPDEGRSLNWPNRLYCPTGDAALESACKIFVNL